MSSYNYLSFQRKVKDALQSVEQALELERKPRLAEDVDHTYGAKYSLANLTTNTAIIAFMNALEKLGLDAAVLKSIDKTKPATLQFESSASAKFLKEVKVDVPLNRSYQETEVTEEIDPSKKSTTKTKVMKLLRSSMKSTKSMKAVNHVTEYHWEVEFTWSIYIYSGTSKEDKQVIKARKCTSQIITQSKDGISPTSISQEGLCITWLLQQIDTDGLATQFKVDLEDEETKTPRRNDAVDQAVGFSNQVVRWCSTVHSGLTNQLHSLLGKHNPAKPMPQTFTMRELAEVTNTAISIFNPILPLMEEEKRLSSIEEDQSSGVENKSIIALQSSNTSSNGNDDAQTLLSSRDMSALLNEHVRDLGEQLSGVETSWPADGSDRILSSSEATLALLIVHLRMLSSQYYQSMMYIETMMENQLIAAIGKKLESKDLDKFVKHHNARLLQPMPQPFSHAIRRPDHYPVGLLSIESKDGETECIYSHSREVNPTSNLKIPLSAASVLELTGQQYLHGYMNHRFGSSRKSHQLIARARQFSAFILVIGTMTDGSTLDPKDAIIVQNKDELLIPLLLEELPTAKEFKDAIKSLSPEQQRFARAYRKMQLASSVFGVCVIQIKPQLEALLGLPPDALDKEMKLTQDLMELFIEYQVPSDLLSYSGFSVDVAIQDKIANVRDNVKSVMDVIEAERGKQLKAEQAKTEMALEKTFQNDFGGAEDLCYMMARAARGRQTEAINDDVMGMESMAVPCSAPVRGSHSRDFTMTKKKKSAGPPAASMQRLMMAEGRQMAMPHHQLDDFESRIRRKMAPPEAASALELDLDSSRSGGHGAHSPSSSKIAVDGQAQKLQVTSKQGESVTSGQGDVDFTLIPQILDSAVEQSGDGNAIRSTTIKTGDNWVRNRQENILSAPKKQRLSEEDVKKEKNKAFDLLDALSRSGSLPIEHSELHVVVAVTHCFDKSVMSTVVQDNVNPIEKLECSTLLLASAMHGVPARELIRDASELQRLEGALPLLMGAPIDIEDQNNA